MRSIRVVLAVIALMGCATRKHGLCPWNEVGQCVYFAKNLGGPSAEECLDQFRADHPEKVIIFSEQLPGAVYMSCRE